MQIVRRWAGKKAANAWVFARAAAVFALALLTQVPIAAEAGFKNAVTLTGGRQTLENGKVYIVDSDHKVQAGAGLPAYAVNANSTAVLYIPAGKTLTLKGGAASGTSGGEAGISLPASSTLIVTGGGTLEVTGGKAANGTIGGDWRCNSSWGGKADVGYDNTDSTGGGHGGNGGGGAGAAIGGKGGTGGTGGTGGDGFRKETSHGSSFVKDGNNGSGGSAGGAGTAMGTLYVLGSVTIDAKAGAAGLGGGGGDRKSVV